jgi:hypothetical protein
MEYQFTQEMRICKFLHDWPEDNLAMLVKRSRLMACSKKQILFKEGDLAEEIFFIHSGEVEVPCLHVVFSRLGRSQQRSIYVFWIHH